MERDRPIRGADWKAVWSGDRSCCDLGIAVGPEAKLEEVAEPWVSSGRLICLPLVGPEVSGTRVAVKVRWKRRSSTGLLLVGARRESWVQGLGIEFMGLVMGLVLRLFLP